jgi:hypothetical protein
MVLRRAHFLARVHISISKPGTEVLTLPTCIIVAMILPYMDVHTGMTSNIIYPRQQFHLSEINQDAVKNRSRTLDMRYPKLGFYPLVDLLSLSLANHTVKNHLVELSRRSMNRQSTSGP